jgi:hypothetical protein
VAAHAPELPDCVTELRQRDVATLLGPSLDGGRGAPAVRRSETEETPREEVAVADAAGCRRRRGAERGGEGFRVCAGGEEEDAGEAGAASCSGHTHGPSSWAALCPGRVTFDYQGRLFKKKRKGKLKKKHSRTSFVSQIARNLSVCRGTQSRPRVHDPRTRQAAPSNPAAGARQPEFTGRAFSCLISTEEQKMDEATQFQTKALILLFHATQGT